MTALAAAELSIDPPITVTIRTNVTPIRETAEIPEGTPVELVWIDTVGGWVRIKLPDDDLDEIHVINKADLRESIDSKGQIVAGSLQFVDQAADAEGKASDSVEVDPVLEPRTDEKGTLTFDPPVEVTIRVDVIPVRETEMLPEKTRVDLLWIDVDSGWIRVKLPTEDPGVSHTIHKDTILEEINNDGTITPYIPAGPEIQALLDQPDSWDSEELPGTWEIASSGSTTYVKEIKNVDLFGHTAYSVQAFIKKGRIERFEILWVDAPLLLSHFQSDNIKNAIRDAEEAKDRNLVRKLQDELEEAEEAELLEAQRKFAKLCEELEDSLDTNLTESFGVEGKRVRVGTGPMANWETEHDDTFVCVRTLFDRTQVVATTITRSADVNRGMVGSTIGRRAEVQKNVQGLPDTGDVILENVPASNQGPRGYCMFGSLAMVLQYYGASTTMERLHATYPGGFLEAGSTARDRGDVRGDVIYLSARQCKLRIQDSGFMSFADIMRNIDKGMPIIVWRKFTNERQAVHDALREAVAEDPNYEAPNPRLSRVKDLWPGNGRNETSYHASVITGYNRERGEVLFSESRGNQARNARMSKEEMKATGYRYILYQP